MEINENTELTSSNPFPFNNLFLIKGYVTGKNQLWQYVLGILIAFSGYLLFQLVMQIYRV